MFCFVFNYSASISQTNYFEQMLTSTPFALHLVNSLCVKQFLKLIV